MMLCCIFHSPIWLLWVTHLLDFVEGDAICQQAPELPLTYCYGITAYCCQNDPGKCCWDEIWRVWWFWIVVLVMTILVVSCCSFYCNNAPSGGRCDIFRRNSFDMLHRFRRFPSREYSPTNDEWKPSPEAVLPPYSSVPPITSGTTETSNQQDPTGSATHSNSPPPSYDTAVSESQSQFPSETTSLLFPPQPQEGSTS